MREKLELDTNEEFWFTGLFGVSMERWEEITSEKFCGLPEGHTVAEHLQSLWNREDVTDAEMAIILYDKGVQIGMQTAEDSFSQRLSSILSKIKPELTSPPKEEAVH